MTTIPKNAKEITIRPLALGEKTGHSHTLTTLDAEQLVEDQVKMFEVEGGVFIRVTGGSVALVHEEHKTQRIAPGEYQVTIQQEVTDWGTAPVQD